MPSRSSLSNWRRMWFPFGLVVCLLIMIPGAILFLLNLLGRETEVNRWLEETFRLSYHIPIPWWGALLMFLVPPILILLYFLKLKRKPVEVPSTFLWKKSIEDLHVNSLFQWLRNNVLLLLQLLIVLALIYAILAPRLHGAGGVGKHFIILIDNSASMSATDAEGGSRLEWAKAEAIKEIDAAGDDDVGMVVVFNTEDGTQTRQSYIANKALLRQRVREIEPTQRTTQIKKALELVEGLANQVVSSENEAVKPENVEPGKERVYAPAEGIKAEVHLYSDGRFPDAPDFVLGNLDLRYHVAGQTDQRPQNVGIVSFNAIRDENDPSLVQLFARVLNFGEQAIAVKVEVDVRVEGELLKQFNESVTIPGIGQRQEAGGEKVDRPGERSVTFNVSGLDDQKEVVIHARLAGHKDLFDIDNEAWLVVGVVRKARVLIVGPGNAILRAFFDDDATKAISDVTWMSKVEFDDDEQRRRKYLEPARAGAFDLVVFDRVAPKTEDEMPRSNTVFIGSVPPSVKIDPARKIQKLFVMSGRPDEPILKYITSLHEIGIGTAQRVDDVPANQRLMEAEDNLVLMFRQDRGAHKDIVQTFPLISEADEWNTNWPLQPSFPIFWRNVLYVLGNVSDASTEGLVQPGMVQRLRPTAATEKVRVTDPSDRTIDVERDSSGDFAFKATDRVGVYQAEWTDGGRRFAVNLLDADESNLQPRDTIRIGDSTVTTQATPSRSRDLWKWAVVVGLLFLLLEWYIYNKRVYI